MDINQVVRLYMDGAAPEAILAAIRECDVNAVDRNSGGQSLLHIAARNAHPEAIEYLVEQGLNPNDATAYDDLPIFFLAGRSFMGRYTPRPGDIYKSALALLEARASAVRKDERDLLPHHYAAKAGNHEFLRALADKGVRINKTDGDGNTGLHLIVEATHNPLNDLEKIKEALAYKKSGNGPQPRHYTSMPLEELESMLRKLEDAMEDLFKAAVVFMQAETDPEAKNSMLETAHQLAVRRGAKKIAALLDGSYSPDDDSPEAEARLAMGGMNIYEAVRQRDAGAIRAIVADGADVNAFSDDEGFRGLTPLAVACLTCDVDTARLLIELGADVSLKSAAGSPPIAYLFTSAIDINLGLIQKVLGQKLPRAMLKLMVEHGFDINSSATDAGDTILGLACMSEHGRGGRNSVKGMIADEALRLGAEVDKSNIHGQTPLMFACAGGLSEHEDIQIILLEAGADAARQDKGGNTALHYALSNPSERGATVMAEMLFELASPKADAVNNQGKTALDIAVERKFEGVAKLLLNHM